MQNDSDFFLQLGLSLVLGGGRQHSQSQATKQFHSLYGASPFVCSLLWGMIVGFGELDPYCHPKHLMWTLLFLKTYLPETILSIMLDATEKTIRKWIWYIIDTLSDLEPDLVSAEDVQMFNCRRDHLIHSLLVSSLFYMITTKCTQ